MRHLEWRRVIKLLHLLMYGFNNFFTTVTCIDAPEAGARVEQFLAIDGGEVHVFCTFQNARGCFELAVAGKGHPEIGHVHSAGQADRFSDGVHWVLR